MMSELKDERTIEERLAQAEKDIIELTLRYRDLLTWKKNLELRNLPDTQHPRNTPR